MLLISGESAEPEQVFSEICAEAERVAREGLNAELFERIRRADYGTRLRGLGRFGDLAYDIASGAFAGFCALDAFALTEAVGREEAEKFIADTLSRDKLALSVVRPRT